MVIQWDGTVACIEGASGKVFRSDVNANPSGLLLSEPSSQMAKQLRGDAAPALFLDDVDPLQLGVATESTSEMACYEADQSAIFVGCDQNPWCQCLAGMQLACHVAMNT